jgi:hypothetical protein
MSDLKSPFMGNKDVLWRKLCVELDGEFRFPPLEGQKTNIEVRHDDWGIKISIDSDPSDLKNPGIRVPMFPASGGGMGS